MPAFARGRRWWKRASKAEPQIKRRVWFDPSTGFEYEADPNPARLTWHEIDWRGRRYREIDPDSGQPVQGGKGEGEWRVLK